MSEFAKETTVNPEKSRAEIETTLRRYKADQFVYGWSDDAAIIGFRAFGRQVRFQLKMPDRKSREFTTVLRRGRVYDRTDCQAEAAWGQSVRQRWRALLLVIKAKLEAVGSGITTFETEFMGHIVLPGGETVGEWMKPQIEAAYRTGRMPPLLEFKADAARDGGEPPEVRPC